MTNEKEKNLNRKFDDILFQLSKGNTIENLKKNTLYIALQKVKEWQCLFGYHFHVYSNDHLIDKKPHFHLVNTSKKLDCRYFFDGNLHDCKGNRSVDKKINKALKYFLSDSKVQKELVLMWNKKNPTPN